MIILNSALKSFTLHLQGGLRLPVIEDARLNVASGECVALTGPSGTGKSTLMRMIYGNYLTEGGSIMVGDLDVATASPREI
ncbi:MAG: ATP-binding cassette domain-containing protein, partial [Pseudomonadota bacterium]